MTALPASGPEGQAPIRAQDAAVEDVILEQMDEGVLVVGFGGAVVTLNAAAERILGTRREVVVDQPLAAVLLQRAGLDPFTQLVLDAVTSEQTADRRTVAVEVDGEPRLLSVSTTYLRTGLGAARRRRGIIAVFADITAAEALRESELRLGQQVREQFDELQEAYRSVEDNNTRLATALRRVRVVQGIAAAAVVAVFALAGTFAWNVGADPGAGEPPADALADEPGDLRPVTAFTVVAERLRTTVDVTGELTPRAEVGVLSPVDATVRAVFVRYGDVVSEGQKLVALDLGKARQTYRAERAAYIKAEQRVRELERWEDGPAVTGARRALVRATSALEQQGHRVAKTAFLLKRGVIPASEHTAAEARLASLRLDHEVAVQALAAARAKGGPEAREVARLEFENLRDRIAELEAVTATDVLRAPVGGVVLAPTDLVAAGGGLAAGRAVSAGDLVVAVADITALAVDARVDELDVADVRIGQAVTVTSDAAPDLALGGRVANVSAQALAARRGGKAMFAINLVLDPLDVEQRRRLKLGMSVDARIVTRDRADALLIPLAAVAVDGEQATVRLRDPGDGTARVVAVETGITTVHRVEIVSGLAPGDEVLVPDGS